MNVKISYNRFYGDWEIREEVTKSNKDGSEIEIKLNLIWNNHSEKHKSDIIMMNKGHKRRRVYLSKDRPEVQFTVDNLNEAKCCLIIMLFEDI